jgi:ABC-type multidrug transport system fused ATPase/permease subunit
MMASRRRILTCFPLKRWALFSSFQKGKFPGILSGDSDFNFPVREIGGGHSVYWLTMAVSTFSSPTPVFGIAEPPASFSSTAIGWKQPLRFRRTKKPRVISCDYSCIEVRDVCYRPPGTQLNILNGVNFSLREKSFGLIFGKSGSGKTTLLQVCFVVSRACHHTQLSGTVL